jgi:hypothetical protein
MNDTNFSASNTPESSKTQAETEALSRRYAGNDPRRKSSIITILLSMLPGLGHAYVGYYKRGFIHFAIYGCAVSLHTSEQLDALAPLTFLFVPFFWVFTQIDAYRRAMLYNLTLDGVENAPLPDDFSSLGTGANMVGGVALTVIGLIALSNTQFGISLDWIENWWPVAPIALGAYLIFQSMKDKS